MDNIRPLPLPLRDMVRLGTLKHEILMFFLEKIDKVRRALEEERWLTAIRLEVEARERSTYTPPWTRDAMRTGTRSLDSSPGFETSDMPSKEQAVPIPDQDKCQKRKRFASRAPKGVKRPASGRTETVDVEEKRELVEQSRRPTREWVRSGSVSRRRSESRTPSTA